MYAAPDDDPFAPAQIDAESNQLSLCFHGEVYVFDCVPPEKAQAVLSLLGGHEVPLEATGPSVPLHPIPKGSQDVPRSSNKAHRLEAINRYREKRKNLCFKKKVTYVVRKEVASRMKRCRGQFASSKPNSDEVKSIPLSSDPTPHKVEKEICQTFCQNCGANKDSTPLMRRGPGGAKSLCNACGLVWANKGILRCLPQGSLFKVPDPSVSTDEKGDSSDSNVECKNNTDCAAASNGDISVMTAEIGFKGEGYFWDATELQWATGLGKDVFVE